MPRRTPIPYIPPKLDRADLQPNGKLMSDADIHLLRQLLKNMPDQRYGKKYLKDALGIDFPFAVQKSGDQLIAIYRGVKIRPGETKGKELGKGAFGVVKLGQDLGTGDFTVFKVIKVTSEKVKEFTDREIQQLDQLKMLAIKPTTYISSNVVDGVHQGYIPKILVGMKLAPGAELWKLVEPGSALDHFNPLQRFMMAKSLLKSTKAAHAEGILHRDIKPDNFVCDPGTCDAKLVDLGFSRDVKEIATTAKSLSESGSATLDEPGKKFDLVLQVEKQDEKKAVGTPLYMAPEIINQDPKIYNEATEVYALGQTIADIFGLTTEDMPIFIKNDTPDNPNGKFDKYPRQRVVDETDRQFQKNDRLPKDPASCKELLTLLQNMTSKEPKDRPPLNEAYIKIDKLLKKEFDQEFKVGIIQIEDFAGLTLKKQLKLIQEMKSKGITAIALGHKTSGQPDMLAYQHIRQLLANNNFLNVVPIAFSDPSKSALQQDAVQYFQSHFQVKPTVYEIAKKLKKIEVKLPVQSAPASKVETPKMEAPKMEAPVSQQVTTPTTATAEAKSNASDNGGVVVAPQVTSWVNAKKVAPSNHAATLFSVNRSGSAANNQLTLEQQIERLPIYKGMMNSTSAQVVLQNEAVGAYLLRYSPEKKAYYMTIKLNGLNEAYNVRIDKQDLEKFLNGKQSEVIQKVVASLSHNNLKEVREFADSLARPGNSLHEMQGRTSKPVPVR